MPRPSWCRLLLLWVRWAASRTFWTAGSSSPMRMAIMAITTNSSMSVKAERQRGDERMADLQGRKVKERKRKGTPPDERSVRRQRLLLGVTVSPGACPALGRFHACRHRFFPATSRPVGSDGRHKLFGIRGLRDATFFPLPENVDQVKKKMCRNRTLSDF